MMKRYTFEQLENGKLSSVPNNPGIYIVYADLGFELKIAKPTYEFKDGEQPLDLTIIRTRYKALKDFYNDTSEWRILYIGKAKNLQNRIKQYLNYGLGKGNNHRGGKDLFAIKNWEKLTVQFKDSTLDEYSDDEWKAIHSFEAKHGLKPLANKINGKASNKASLYPDEISQGIYEAIKNCKKYVKELYADGWDNQWPEKCTSIDFKYNGKSYSIPYSEFDIKFCDQSMIYNVADVFKKKCKGLGLTGIKPSGFMD